MIPPPPGCWVWIAAGHTDMRCSMRGGDPSVSGAVEAQSVRNRRRLRGGRDGAGRRVASPAPHHHAFPVRLHGLTARSRRSSAPFGGPQSVLRRRPHRSALLQDDCAALGRLAQRLFRHSAPPRYPAFKVFTDGNAGSVEDRRQSSRCGKPEGKQYAPSAGILEDCCPDGSRAGVRSVRAFGAIRINGTDVYSRDDVESSNCAKKARAEEPQTVTRRVTQTNHNHKIVIPYVPDNPLIRRWWAH